MFRFVRGVIPPAGFPVNAQHVVAAPLAVDQCRLAVAGDPNSPLCRRAATAWPTRSPRFYQGFKLGFSNGNQYAPDEECCN
jgi:hypothetical protein